tara:strand:+ start:1095 stop:2390 length:1296 start_codon:yes stop_codon:yes gene_type:complete
LDVNYSLTRRRWLAGALSGLAVAPLLTRAAFAQDRQLRFFWWGNQERLARTEAAMDVFMAQNPGVSVTGETAPFDDFFTRLATQVVGGNPPDLIQMDFRYIAEYAGRGVLLDLDPYLGNVLDLSDIPTDQVDANRVNGKLYGVSFGVNSAAMLINQTAWDEAGVAAPHHGMTYEQFAENCARLTQATPRSNVYGTSDASGNDIAFENWLKQQNKALYTADGELGYDENDAAGWFKLWADMRQSKACVPADIQALEQGTIDTSGLTLGHSASTFMLANQIGPQQAAVTETIVPVPLPRISDDAAPGHYLRPATRLSVAAQTKHPDEAVALLAFLTGNPEAAKLLGADRGIPSSPRLAKAIAADLKPAEKASVEFVASLGELVGALPPPLPPGAGEVTRLVFEISQQVAFESMSPTDGGAALVQGARDLLSRA